MKRIGIFFLLISLNCYAAGRRVTFTSGSPGVATYSTAGKSLIASEVGSMTNWELTNYTAFDMDCVFTSDSANAPANGNGSAGGGFTKEFFLTASEHLPLYNFTTGSRTSVYCRGDVSAPTSGEFILNSW